MVELINLIMKKIAVLISLIPFLYWGATNSLINFADSFTYNSDIKKVIRIAEDLGYSKNQELNYYRYKPVFSNTDSTKIVFGTTETLDEFSQKVARLDLQPNTTAWMQHIKRQKDHSFIQFINKERPYAIVFTDPRSENSVLPQELHPTVSEWHFTLSATKNKRKTISIYYAEPPGTNVSWKHKPSGRIINRAIVAIDFNR